MASQIQRLTLGSSFFLPAPEKLASPLPCWAAPHSQFFWNTKTFGSITPSPAPRTTGSIAPSPAPRTMPFATRVLSISECSYLAKVRSPLSRSCQVAPVGYFQNYLILRNPERYWVGGKETDAVFYLLFSVLLLSKPNLKATKNSALEEQRTSNLYDDKGGSSAS